MTRTFVAVASFGANAPERVRVVEGEGFAEAERQAVKWFAEWLAEDGWLGDDAEEWNGERLGSLAYDHTPRGVTLYEVRGVHEVDLNQHFAERRKAVMARRGEEALAEAFKRIGGDGL